MTTVGVARAATLFSVMWDRFVPFTANDVRVAKATYGVSVFGQYLEMMTAASRDAVWSEGGAILLLSDAPTGNLSAAAGHSKASSLLALATGLGAPKGLHLMVDFEAQTGDAEGYATAITSDIAAGGDVPPVYGGAGEALTGHQVYELPNAHLYWRGGSLGIPEPDCGFAVWQVPPLSHQFAGVSGPVDVSMIGEDGRGRSPVLWFPS
jgi:hypothetical protein